jgi:hypothetical protein
MDSMSGGLDAGRLQKKVTEGSCVRMTARSTGEVVMLKRNGMALDGADEAILRVRQDEEFCRILRSAIEQGHEFCSIGVNTEPGTKKPMVMKHKPPDSYY